MDQSIGRPSDMKAQPQRYIGPSPSRLARQLRRERRLEEMAIRRAKNREAAKNETPATDAALAHATGKKLSREYGERTAAERAERKRLRPIARAQERQRQERKAEELSKERQKFRAKSPDEQHAHMTRRILGEPVQGNPDFVGGSL